MSKNPWNRKYLGVDIQTRQKKSARGMIVSGTRAGNMAGLVGLCFKRTRNVTQFFFPAYDQLTGTANFKLYPGRCCDNCVHLRFKHPRSKNELTFYFL